jgi:hypothetical protein
MDVERCPLRIHVFDSVTYGLMQIVSAYILATYFILPVGVSKVSYLHVVSTLSYRVFDGILLKNVTRYTNLSLGSLIVDHPILIQYINIALCYVSQFNL